MTRRTTVGIAEMIDATNKMLAESIGNADVRHGWIGLLRHVLHSSNVYAGFGYLNAEQVPAGHLPGIIWNDSGTGIHQHPDESRIFFYHHRALQKSAKAGKGTR